MTGWNVKTDIRAHITTPVAYKYASCFDITVCPGAKYETNPPRNRGWATLKEK
jgi:hypothetical protein